MVGGTTQRGTTVNLSQGGVLVETSPLPQLGDKVVLRIRLPGAGATSEIACIVRWCREPDGVGLQFENLRAIEVWALNKLLKSIQPK